jgi:hypothetical protein
MWLLSGAVIANEAKPSIARAKLLCFVASLLAMTERQIVTLPIYSSVASSVILVLSSFDTGQPAFAMPVSSANFA